MYIKKAIESIIKTVTRLAYCTIVEKNVQQRILIIFFNSYVVPLFLQVSLIVLFTYTKNLIFYIGFKNVRSVYFERKSIQYCVSFRFLCLMMLTTILCRFFCCCCLGYKNANDDVVIIIITPTHPLPSLNSNHQNPYMTLKKSK